MMKCVRFGVVGADWERCISWRCRLTPPTLRWAALSSASLERGLENTFVMLNGVKHLLWNRYVEEDPSSLRMTN